MTQNGLPQSHRQSMQSAMKKTIRIRRVSSKKELQKAFAIRTRVFVKEQGVPEAIELDRDDRRAWHFLAFAGRRPVGTARIVIRRGKAKIGRMAVLKRYLRQGMGMKIHNRAVDMV